jgi:hypothetical protein
VPLRKQHLIRVPFVSILKHETYGGKLLSEVAHGRLRYSCQHFIGGQQNYHSRLMEIVLRPWENNEHEVFPAEEIGVI